MGGSLMTLWLGQDGFDYSFQVNYQQLWDHTLEALAVICDHNKDIDISLEYKPNEPRSYSLMPDVGSNLLALSELNRPNTGITLDFAPCSVRRGNAGSRRCHGGSLFATAGGVFK